MSVITRAKIVRLYSETKFEDKACLLSALKDRNIKFAIDGNEILITSPESIRLVKKGSNYVVEYEAETEVVTDGYTVREKNMIGQETENGKRKVNQRKRQINNLIYIIEESYDRILAEKIEMLRYEQESFQNIQNNEERRKKNIAAEREMKRLERIKRKREMEKRKLIEEKTQKLKERAKMLGYDIEEKVVNNERTMVLVRRR